MAEHYTCLDFGVKFAGLFLFPFIAAFAAAPPSSLQILPVANPTVNGVLPMPNGQIAVFGSAANPCIPGGFGACPHSEAPLLAILDASGNQIGGLMASAFGGGDSVIASAALDANGDIWVTGTTDSDDFPLVNPLYPKKVDYAPTGFAAKLDPTLKILFSTFVGGQKIPATGLSTPTNVAIDSAGNAFIVGSTYNPNFPVTGAPFGDATVSAYFTFISKVSADGSKLIFGRLLGGNGSPCVGGSACIGYGVYTRPSSIALDSSGNLTIAGGTNATDFPVTANVGQNGGGAFVARISGDGSQLIWSTEIGVHGDQAEGFSSVQSIAFDSSGNIYIAGTTPVPIPGTPGTLQPTVQAPPGTNVFAAKLSADGTKLLFATNLSGKAGSYLSGLTLDASGNVWITGNTSSADFPGLNNTAASNLDFVLELNANASALQDILALIPGTVNVPPVADSNGNLVVAASAGNILRLNPPTALTAPAVFALTNSAIPRMTTGVSPGEIATIYGTGLGPNSGITGMPDLNGLYPTQLGGVSVQFGSVPAPLLYVSSDQINFQAPFNASAGTMTVITPGGSLPVMQLQPIRSIGIFGVVNPDGTVNSASNPAPEGSIVSLYATGLGAPAINALNGAISTSAIPAFQGSVEVERGGLVLPVLYAGTAPDLINGLDQVNAELPAGLQNPQLQIAMPLYNNFGLSGSASSNGVTVYTK